MSPDRRVSRLQLFAVEDTSAQVCWASLPSGPVRMEVAGRVTDIEVGPGPGSVLLEGLRAGERLTLRVSHRAGSGWADLATRTFATLPPPPGRLLGRFAAITDLHIGDTKFGFLPVCKEAAPAEPHPERSLRAALAEAVGWGAELVVAKGDLTRSGRARQFDTVADLLGAAGVPVHVVLGNHDVWRRAADPVPAFERVGVHYDPEPSSLDLAGIRLVFGHSSVPGRTPGRIDAGQRATLADLVGKVAGPAWLAMHHYPQPLPFRTTKPAGLRSDDADPLFDALREANPNTMVTTGHSHRHRLHRRRGLLVAETGSTKDYPGTWAGYSVYEGAIRQVVRRIAEPSVLGWTERTGSTVLGVWGPYAAGRRRDRCFTEVWR